MVKTTAAKRCTASTPGPPPAKRKRANRHDRTASSSILDLVCDNTLLKILSYADLSSIVNLTRCTCKSLRDHFDPQNETSSNLLPKIWKEIFADLHMGPLDEAKESLNHFDAIRYRMTLFNTLIGRNNSKNNGKGGGSRKQLPLRHHYLKPLPADFDFSFTAGSDARSTYMEPFSLLSGGTGGQYVCINPDIRISGLYGRIEIKESLMENAICQDKSTQGKIAASSNYTGVKTLEASCIQHVYDGPPSQILSHYSGSMETCGPVNWASYFGDRTPFAAESPNPHRNPHVFRAMIFSYDYMEEDRASIKERSIGMIRMVNSGDDNHICSEIITWSSRPEQGSHFVIKGTCRTPGDWHVADVCTSSQYVYTTFSEDSDLSLIPGNSPAHVEDVRKVVYQFPLKSESLYQPLYPEPVSNFISGGQVSALAATCNNLVVGTEAGGIEIWSVSGVSRPSLLHIIFTNAFLLIDLGLELPINPSAISDIYLPDYSSLQYGFMTHQDGMQNGSVISLWQTLTLNFDKSSFYASSANFEIVAKLTYDCSPLKFNLSGRRLLVLAFDKFGYMYLDVYLVFNSRYDRHEFEGVDLPTHSTITHLHPEGEHRIKFARKIHIRHRLDFTRLPFVEFPRLPERYSLDSNDRFVTVITGGGLKGDGGVHKSGPGIFVIDLEEHGV